MLKTIDTSKFAEMFVPMDTYLGVDGGGSRTRVLLCDREGRILGRGAAGPTNIQEVPETDRRSNLAEAVDAALVSCPDASIRAAFLGLAGIVGAADRKKARRMAAEVPALENATIETNHDIRIALAGGLAGEPGIALIAGTGSSCYGRNAKGESYQCGGWGSLADDIGSGGWLGLRALECCVRQADGRETETGVKAAVFDFLGIRSMDDFQARVHDGSLDRTERGRLAPRMVELAAHGDTAATRLLASGCRGLAELVEVTARELQMTAPPVAVVGGLTENPVFRNTLDQAIGTAVPNADIRSPQLPPLAGAALLALYLGEQAVDATTLRKLSQSESASSE